MFMADLFLESSYPRSCASHGIPKDFANRQSLPVPAKNSITSRFVCPPQVIDVKHWYQHHQNHKSLGITVVGWGNTVVGMKHEDTKRHQKPQRFTDQKLLELLAWSFFEQPTPIHLESFRRGKVASCNVADDPKTSTVSKRANVDWKQTSKFHSCSNNWIDP